MREIKYRVWDNLGKEMIAPNDFSQKADSNGMVYLSDFFTINKDKTVGKEKEDIILMQYTGLKDKNGKEIFEGDIIRSYHQKGEVECCCGAFGIMLNPEDFMSLYDIWDRGDGHKVEKIGNIYENPNLIKI